MTILISIVDTVILLCLYIFFLHPKLSQKGKKERITASLFYLYICVVFALTLLPIIPTFDAPSINLIPFRDFVYQFGDYMRQIVLNILLFVPMGIFMPHFAGTKCGKTVLYCGAISLAIELLQPWVTLYRVCDITDLITNTIGATLGYMIYAGIKRILQKRKRA